jgi:signal transduction histidine kinase
MDEVYADRDDADWRLERRHDRLETYRSVVSHDLRTPLNVAQGYLDFVRSGDVEDEDELLEQVAASLDRLEAYLTDLGTLEAQGTPVEETVAVDLAGVAAETWESVETADASLEIETTATVTADRGRLVAAFRNVYRNAVEHGGASGTVTVGDLDDGFYVADDGDGPEVGGYDDLFEPGFSTTDGATGLGLAIVDQIAAAHRWRVSASEGSDGGVRIEFRDVR